MPHKQWTESRQGREGKTTVGFVRKIRSSQERVCKGLYGLVGMLSHDVLQRFQLCQLPRDKSTGTAPTRANFSPNTPGTSAKLGHYFYLPLSPSLPSLGEQRKNKAIFYVLVKYNLLNVLCQCIKLPAMLIEYLIDIYLLTSYLC